MSLLVAVLAAFLYLTATMRRDPDDDGDGPRRRRNDTRTPQRREAL
ncbi:hypothetical protein [Actinoplanes sp. NPDC051859]